MKNEEKKKAEGGQVILILMWREGKGGRGFFFGSFPFSARRGGVGVQFGYGSEMVVMVGWLDGD